MQSEALPLKDSNFSATAKVNAFNKAVNRIRQEFYKNELQIWSIFLIKSDQECAIHSRKMIYSVIAVLISELFWFYNYVFLSKLLVLINSKNETLYMDYLINDATMCCILVVLHIR